MLRTVPTSADISDNWSPQVTRWARISRVVFRFHWLHDHIEATAAAVLRAAWTSRRLDGSREATGRRAPVSAGPAR